MSKLHKIGAIAVSSILMSVSLTACSNPKEEAPAKDTVVVKAEAEKVNEEVEPTLAEQGFTLKHYDIDPSEGNVILKLNGPSGEYFGMMDSNFNWVLKPQNMEVLIETESESELEHSHYFSEGLMRVAVREDRKIRANQGQEEEWKWGYMNTTGEWVIEPAYRHVSAFSNGFAIVTTIEEDRDDLTNARQIVIDQKGKEVFELTNYNISDRPEENFENKRFSNGYLKTTTGIYDSQGKFYKTDFLEGITQEEEDSFGNSEVSYEIINEQIVFLNQSKLMVYDLFGKSIKSIPLLQETDSEPRHLFISEELSKENKFIVRWSSSKARIMDLEGKTYGEPIEEVLNEDQIGYSAPYLFVNEERYDEETEEYENTIIVYNYNGEKVVSLPTTAKEFHNKRYWIEGEEYDKLLSFDGQVLLDEDKKVVTDNHKGHLEGPVILVKRRINAEAPEMTDILLNTVTFETIAIGQILSK